MYQSGMQRVKCRACLRVRALVATGYEGWLTWSSALVMINDQAVGETLAYKSVLLSAQYGWPFPERWTADPPKFRRYPRRMSSIEMSLQRGASLALIFFIDLRISLAAFAKCTSARGTREPSQSRKKAAQPSPSVLSISLFHEEFSPWRRKWSCQSRRGNDGQFCSESFASMERQIDANDARSRTEQSRAFHARANARACLACKASK